MDLGESEPAGQIAGPSIHFDVVGDLFEPCPMRLDVSRQRSELVLDDLVSDERLAESDAVVSVFQGDGETGSGLAVHAGGNDEAFLVEVL